MTCPECERLDRLVAQCERAVLFHQQKIKDLASLKFSEIRQIEFESQGDVRDLSIAKSNRTRHWKQCKHA